MFQETMEAMRIMGIPDEEQIGMSPLESLKCKKIKEEIGHISLDLYFWFLPIFQYFFVVTLFLLPPAQTQNEQGASGERSSFGVTHLRIYQHSFSSYIQS